ISLIWNRIATKPSSATAACAICASVPYFCQKVADCDICSLLRRDHVDGIAHADVVDIGLVRILADAFLDLVTEMRDQALDRPGCGIAERADGVALDLLGYLKQHVDLALVGAALRHAGQDAPHPPRA